MFFFVRNVNEWNDLPKYIVQTYVNFNKAKVLHRIALYCISS